MDQYISWRSQSLSDGTIKRSNLDGSSVETLISGLAWAYGIALDVPNDHIYYSITDFSTPTNSSINRANLDGTGIVSLIDSSTPGTPAQGAREIALVPEPSTYALLIGLGAVLFAVWKRRQSLSS